MHKTQCVCYANLCVESAKLCPDSNQINELCSMVVIELYLAIPEVEQSKARVCGLSFTSISGLNPAGCWLSLLLLSCCEVRRADPSSTDCGVSK